MDNEIQHADQRLRRVTTIVLSLATTGSIAVIYAFHQWLLRASATLPTRQLVMQVHAWGGICITGVGLCLLLLAGYFARIAQRTMAQKRWPPESMKMLLDTPIRRDQRAVSTGRALNFIALALMALAVLAGVMSWQMFHAAH